MWLLFWACSLGRANVAHARSEQRKHHHIAPPAYTFCSARRSFQYGGRGYKDQSHDIAGRLHRRVSVFFPKHASCKLPKAIDRRSCAIALSFVAHGAVE